MQATNNTDLQGCLSIQPRKPYRPVSKIAQELINELLTLVNEDTNKAIAIIKEIMYYSPNQSLEWYCEQAIRQLHRKSYSTPNFVIDSKTLTLAK
ncbi:hypothetical protein NIES4102_23650 [Chondrocystis sp. NIES-4102]|nr:hypothetical protein NIES4102_23650 [Chondrocystis sp. NIES-4102]